MMHRVDEIPAQLSKGATDWAISLSPYVGPASPEDAIARRAVAEIEREDGFDRCAQLRLHGSYDGDTEHRIAMKAIELFREQHRDGSASNKPLPRNS
ncbi:hypothetical protein [Sphingomonas segetis]|jgi:hypothetical protein|uniref:hypothetical protein n=1 Tax=Sphingomonas segetis TaxID=1104779 RepID=UPI0012D2FF7E|nr:hypothetical protein [Sphingomonas segetis]